jgi:hypothetical protein
MPWEAPVIMAVFGVCMLISNGRAASPPGFGFEGRAAFPSRGHLAQARFLD